MTICTKCKYEWKYKGKLYWATCPRCRKLVRVVEEVAGEALANNIDEAEKQFMKEYKETNDILLFNRAVDQFGQDRVKELLHKNAV